MDSDNPIFEQEQKKINPSKLQRRRSIRFRGVEMPFLRFYVIRDRVKRSILYYTCQYTGIKNDDKNNLEQVPAGHPDLHATLGCDRDIILFYNC